MFIFNLTIHHWWTCSRKVSNVYHTTNVYHTRLALDDKYAALVIPSDPDRWSTLDVTPDRDSVDPTKRRSRWGVRPTDDLVVSREDLEVSSKSYVHVSTQVVVSKGTTSNDNLFNVNQNERSNKLWVCNEFSKYFFGIGVLQQILEFSEYLFCKLEKPLSTCRH
jgi:hypothetical protein